MSTSTAAGSHGEAGGSQCSKDELKKSVIEAVRRCASSAPGAAGAAGRKGAGLDPPVGHSGVPEQGLQIGHHAGDARGALSRPRDTALDKLMCSRPAPEPRGRGGRGEVKQGSLAGWLARPPAPADPAAGLGGETSAARPGQAPAGVPGTVAAASTAAAGPGPSRGPQASDRSPAEGRAAAGGPPGVGAQGRAGSTSVEGTPNPLAAAK
jgi:hypothetical protein